MTRLEAAIARVLHGLPAELRQLIAERVRFVTRPRPTAVDLELGIGADWRGAFVGEQLGDSDDARGVVLVFLDNLARGDDDELDEILLHELDHFLGADEDDVAGDGLGEHMGLAEVAP